MPFKKKNILKACFLLNFEDDDGEDGLMYSTK